MLYFKKSFQIFLIASGDYLTNGGGLKKLDQFHNYLTDYRIILYEVFRNYIVIFEGNSLSKKKLHFHYGLVSEHCHSKPESCYYHELYM